MNIVHGTTLIANQPPIITKALRKLGENAFTVNYYQSYLNYKADFDYILANEPDPIKRQREMALIATQMMQDCDIFHFWFNTTFMLDYSDLPLLAKLDRPLFMQHAGSDVRTLAIAKKMNPWAVIKPVNQEMIHKRLSVISQSISTAIVGESRLYEYIKGYYKKVHMVPIALDLDLFPTPTEHLSNQKPLIVHAPTDRNYKGTSYVLSALSELKHKYDFDLVLVENMPYEEALKIYRKADIILDQFLGGGVGGLATEGMALGKTVLCWVCDRAKEGYMEDPPVVSANPDTLKRQLEFVLNEPGFRSELGIKSRKYVERYHDVHHIARIFQKIYRGEEWNQDHYQAWWN